MRGGNAAFMSGRIFDTKYILKIRLVLYCLKNNSFLINPFKFIRFKSEEKTETRQKRKCQATISVWTIYLLFSKLKMTF
jgi:hypothetical protein